LTGVVLKQFFIKPSDKEARVTFYLHGELGNQMFQLATALAVSRQLKKSIELSVLKGNAFRLSKYNNGGKSITFNEISKLRTFLVYFLTKIRKLGVSDNFFFPKIYTESDLTFKQWDVSKSKFFFGYFQSWKYFDHLKDDLLNTFDLKPPDSRTVSLLRNLPNEFTAIHIRRGGRGPSILNSEFHGILSDSYYNNAIHLNSLLGGSSNYVVFTDNPRAAQKLLLHLNIMPLQVIGPEDVIDQLENLWLMSRSTSFIGANSSYSWWAAYLSTTLRTPPIFPRQWYFDARISNSDMLLPDWLTVGFESFESSNEKVGFNEE
jgi:hypothetical protein